MYIYMYICKYNMYICSVIHIHMYMYMFICICIYMSEVEDAAARGDRCYPRTAGVWVDRYYSNTATTHTPNLPINLNFGALNPVSAVFLRCLLTLQDKSFHFKLFDNSSLHSMIFISNDRTFVL